MTRPLDPPLSLQLRVLLAIIDPDAPADLTLGKVARTVGITERTVQAAVADLEAAGLIERTRVGRRNVYRFPTPAARAYCARARIAARMLTFTPDVDTAVDAELEAALATPCPGGDL